MNKNEEIFYTDIRLVVAVNLPVEWCIEHDIEFQNLNILKMKAAAMAALLLDDFLEVYFLLYY